MIPDNQQEQRLLITEYVLGLHRGEQAVEIERWLAERDLVTRDEFEAVKAMAVAAREENERLAERIAKLESRN